MEPDHIRYNPGTGDYGHDFLHTQVSVIPVPQRNHIFTAAQEQRAEDNWAAEDYWELDYCIDAVATRHLQEQTGVNAFIAGSKGETAYVVTLVPDPVTERPYDDAYLSGSDLRPLTEAQEGRLPELAARLRDIVPKSQQPHVEDLARKIAQDIPSRTDLIRAFQRTSVTEVIAEWEARNAPAVGLDDLPASIKIARLNFPEHQHAAVSQPAQQNGAQPAPRTLTTPEPGRGASR